MTDEFVEVSIPLPVSVTALARITLAITKVAPSAIMSQVGNAMTIKCSLEEIHRLAQEEEETEYED